jgi:hypothetical protein
VSDEPKRVVYDGPDGSVRSGWGIAPVEALIENVRQGDIAAWDALLKVVGKTEEDFIREVAERVSKSLEDTASGKNNSETVE